MERVERSGLKRARLLAALAALTSLCGCASITNLKTARALDKGEYELTVAMDFGGIAADNLSGWLYYPEFEFAGRFGVTDGFDLGFKLSSYLGVELDATVQLVRGNFSLALASGVGFAAPLISFQDVNTGDVVSVPVHLDLLAGLSFGEGSQLVFGPGLYAFFTLAESASGDRSTNADAITLLGGGTLGVSFALSPTLRLMPEIDVYFPLVGTINSASAFLGTNSVNGAWVYAFALGVTFGNGPKEGRVGEAAR